MVPCAGSILTVTCPDGTGIVAAVTGFIAAHHGWVIEAAQHGDLNTGRFFQRIEVLADSLPFGAEEFGRRFSDLAAQLRARLEPATTPTTAEQRGGAGEPARTTA